MSGAEAARAANLLRQLRESRGWSWTDLARALRKTAEQLAITTLRDRQVASIQRTVARWESPTSSTSPGERYQVLLAHLYAHTPAGTPALGSGSDFAVLLEALRGFGVSEHRISHVIELTSRSTSNDTSQALDLLPSSASDDVLTHLATTVTGINGQIGSAPLVRLQLQLAPVVETCRRHTLSVQPPLNEDVLTLATETFALAGRLAFDTGDDETADALYREAVTTANRLRDRRHSAAGTPATRW